MSRSPQIIRVRPGREIEYFFNVEDLPDVLEKETVEGDHVILEAGDYTDIDIVIPNGVFLTANNGAIVERPSGATENFVNLTEFGGGVSFTINEIEDDVDTLETDLNSHITDTTNPHQVTKGQIGLGNVENVDTTNASNITSGQIPDAQISESSITQHESSLTIDSSQVSNLSGISTDDLTEGGNNLFFTVERAQDAFNSLLSGGTGIATQYDDSADEYTLNIDFTEFTTDDIVEGSTNLFFTSERVDDRVADLIVGGSGISVDYDDVAGTLTFDTAATTDQLTEGSTNLFFTDQRAIDAVTTGITTDQLTEGSTNLYYTNERVDDRVSNLIVGGSGISVTYDDGSGTLTFDTAANTDQLSEGSTNLFFTNQRAINAVTGNISTDDINEGSSNLFFTEERVDDRVADLIIGGSGISVSYDDAANTLTLDTAATTDQLSEGSGNLFFTDERAQDAIASATAGGTGITFTYDDGADTLTYELDFDEFSTDDVTEGSNFYFTDQRAQDAALQNIVAGTNVSVSYNTGSNNLTISSTDTNTTYSGGSNITISGTTINFDGLAAFSTDDLAEGSTNLYYTDTRTRVALSASGDLNYNSTTGEFSVTTYKSSDFDTDFSGKTTTDLSEGTNLYYTDTRTRNALSASGDLSYNSTTGEFSVTTYKSSDFDTDFSNKSTDDLSEGNNLYYTNARTRAALSASGDLNYDSGTGVFSITTYKSSDFNSDFSGKDTDDLSEGTSNLYYTDVRAHAAFSAAGDLSYDSNGQYSVTTYKSSDFDTDFAAKDTGDLSEGTNLYFTNTRAVNAVDGSTIAELDIGNIKLSGNTISTTNTNGKLILNPDPDPGGTIEAKGDIVPDANDVRTLGTPSLQWEDVYIGPGSLFINNKKVISDESDTITVSTSQDQNLDIQTSGTGITQLLSDENIKVLANIEMSDGSVITSALGPVTFDANIDFNAGSGIDAADLTSGFVPAARLDNASLENVDGTPNPSFALDTDSANTILLKNNAGAVELRNNDDTDFADLEVRNLTVSGTTTTVNSTELDVGDAIITLNSSLSGTPTENAGIEINRGNLTNARLIWDESNDVWKAGEIGALAELAIVSDPLSTFQNDLALSDFANDLDTGDIPENGNKYFTNTRARAAFSAAGDLNYNSSTGTFSVTTYKTSNFNTDFANQTTDELGEGTNNLYYTNARSRSALSATGDLNYDSGTGVFSVTTYKSTDFDSDFGNKTTTDLSEGTNLYFTQTRARNSLSAGGDLNYNSTTGEFSVTTYKTSDFNTDFGNKSTDDLSEGTNLYFTQTRARNSLSASGDLSYDSVTGEFSVTTYKSSDFDTDFGNKSTDDLSEGTNLYYTDSRVRTALSAAGDLNYNSSTGEFSVTTYKSSDFDTDFSAKSTDNLSEGSTNLYYTDTRTRNALSASGDLNYNTATGEFSVTTYKSGDFDAQFNSKTTDNLTEGSTNLYYTDVRVRNALSASGDLSYNSTTGEFSVTTYKSTDFDSDFGTKDTDQLSEGASNLYYTDARVSNYLITNNYTQEGDNISVFTNDTGYITDYTVTEGDVTQHEAALTITESQISDLDHYTSSDFDSDFSAKTTSNLSEGTNLYYTGERVDDRVAGLIVGGTNVTATYSDNGASVAGTLTINATNTTYSAGTNLTLSGTTFNVETDLSQYDNSTSGFISDLSSFTTNDLTEGGSNLYFTAERVDDRVNNLLVAGTDIGITYNDNNNELTIAYTGTHYNSSDFDSDFATKTTDDLSEGSANLYFTNSRSRSALSASGDLSYNVTTGEFSVTTYKSSDFDSDFGSKTTTDLSEGTNLYYTAERAQDDALGNVVGGTNVTINYDDGAGSLTINSTDTNTTYSGGNNITIDGSNFINFDGLGSFSTTDLSEGTNLYYTDERAQDAVSNLLVAGTNVSLSYDDGANSLTISSTDTNTTYSGGSNITITGTTIDFDGLGSFSTTDLSEGTNLYYTDSRARNALSASGDLSYSSATGEFSVTTYKSSDFDTDFNSKSTDDLSEGSVNLYFTDERAQDAVGAILSSEFVYDDVAGQISLDSNVTDSYTNENAQDAVNDLLVGGTHVTLTYDDGADSLTIDVDDNLSAYTNDAGFITGISGFTTDNLTEGSTNLYYTDSRVRNALSASGDLSYNASTGQFSVTTYKSSDFDTDFSAKTTDGLSEGSTNLYYTDSRTRNALSAAGDLSYNSTTGEFSVTTYKSSDFDTDFSGKDTDDLTEGVSNLYFTDERVDDRVNNLLIGGTNVTLSYDDGANSLTIDATDTNTTYTGGSNITISGTTINFDGLASFTTDNLSEGSSNLYYSDTRSRNALSASGDLSYNSTTGEFSVATYKSTDFDTDFSGKDTDDLTEGATNLYYTDTRTRNALSAAGDLSYNSSTGEFSVTTYKSSDFDTDFSGKSTDNLSEGSANLYYTDTRTRNALSASGDLSYNATTGEFSVTTYKSSDFDTDFGNKTTDDLTEGTNLYYTDERVDDRVSSLLLEGSNISLSYDDGANSLTINATDTNTTYTGGSNITVSGTTINFDGLGAFDTDDLSEGSSNLYYTETRVSNNTDVSANTAARHTQNTDTGTTSSTFAIDSDATNYALIKNNSGVIEVRDQTDSNFADLEVFNLTVHGTETIVNTEQLTISDNVITLNSDVSGTPTENSGVAVERGTEPNARIQWDESNDYWEAGVNGTLTRIVLEGDDISLLNNDSGYITDYTVTQSDVTQYENALTITESQISDLDHYSSTDFDSDFSAKTTDNLSEGSSNQYFTNERVDDRVNALLIGGTNVSLNYSDAGNSLTINATDTNTTYSGGTNITISGTTINFDGLGAFDTDDLSEGTTNLYYTQTRFDNDFSAKSTTDLSEGTNLYFTDERVDDRVNTLLVGGTNVNLTYDDGAGSLTIDATDTNTTYTAGTLLSLSGTTFNVENDLSQYDNSTSGFITDYTVTEADVTQHEGAITITESQISDLDHYNSTDFDTDFSAKTTDNLSEGSANLYYTDTRARNALSAAGDLSYNATTGEFSVTTYKSSDFDTDFSAKTTDNLSEGSANLYFTDERVDDRVASLIIGGTNTTVSYDDGANSLTIDSEDTTYSAGTLLSLSGTTFNVENDLSQYDNSTSGFITDYTVTESDVTQHEAALTLTASQISDFGENVDDRANNLLIGGSNIALSYDDGANTLTIDYTGGSSGYDSTNFDNDFASKTTDDLTEGSTNLYFTDERVDDRVSNLLVGGSNTTLTYNDGANTLTIDSVDTTYSAGTLLSLSGTTFNVNDDLSLYDNSTSGFITDYTVTEGDVTQHEAALTITESQISDLDHYNSTDFDTDFGGKSTDNLSEGSSNLYYTDTRTRNALSASGDLSYNSTTGQFSVTTYKSSDFDTDFNSKSTTDLSEGVNLYYTDERAQDAVNNLLVGGTNISLTYDDGANSLTIDATDTNTTYSAGTLISLSGTTFNVENDLSQYDNSTSLFVSDGDNVSVLTNDAGYITDYTVTQSDVTQYEGALTITESQISDLDHYTSTDFDTDFSAKTTDNLSEGSSNQYFTNERVDDRVSNLVVGGTNVSVTYDDTAGTLTFDATDTNTTYSGGSNITITGTTIDFDGLGAFSTSDLSEGSNLYFTNERAQDAVFNSIVGGTNVTVNYDDAANDFTINATDTNTTYTAGSGLTLSGTEFSLTNPHLTEEDVDDRVNSLLIGGSNVTLSYDDGANSLTIDATDTNTTYSGGSNITITGTTIDFDGLGAFDTDDLSEGTSNLYYTDTRARNAVSAAGDLTYDSLTGEFSVTTYKSSDFDTDFGNKSTTDLSEGTNLYYTDERVDDRVSNLVVGGTNVSVSYDDGANTLTFSATDTDTTYTGGSNITITGTTIDFDGLGAFDTDDLSEGSSNLYYTDTRTRNALSASGDLSYNSTTGEFSVTTYKSTDFDTDFGGKDTDDLTEGTTNLYFTDERVDDRVSNLTVGGTNVTITYDDNANTLTFDATDTNTTYTAGTGLTLSGTEFSLTEDYLTQEEVDDRVNNLLIGGTNVSLSYNDGANSLTIDATDTDTTYSAGTNLTLSGTTFNVDTDLSNYDNSSTGFISDISGFTTDNLSEGSTNLYYTDTRARNALSAAGDLSYNSTTGEFSVTTYKSTDFDTDFGGKSTDDLTEGASNLYFTDERVDDRVSNLVVGGTNVSVSYDDGANTLTFDATDTNTTYTGGSNITISGTTIDFDGLGGFSTTDLSEGTNLYYTDERVDDRVNNLLIGGSNVSLTYDDGANSLTIDATDTDTTYTGGSNITISGTTIDFDGLGAFDTDDLSEGSSNLYYTETRVSNNTDVSANTSARHTQGTDTGTTSQTFAIDSDATNYALIKNNAGVIEIRDQADNNFADLEVFNLTVHGTETIINTEQLSISDNVITLNDDVSGTPTENAGVAVERGTSSNARIQWNESNDWWEAGVNGSLVQIALVDENLSTFNNDLDTGDITEGSNLYFTDERVDDRVNNLLIGGTNVSLTYDDGANSLTIDATDTNTTYSAGTNLTLSGTTFNVDTDLSNYDNSTSSFISDISGFSTTDLSEGTNLYFTDERAQDAVNSLLVGGTNVSLTYDDGANSLTIDATDTDTTYTAGTGLTLSGTEFSLTEDYLTQEEVDDRVNTLLIGGTNVSLTYDDGANSLTIDATDTDTTYTGGSNITISGTTIDFDGLGGFSTTDLSEGTNLYYTDERVDDRVNNLLVGGTDIGLSYDDGANSLTINYTGTGGGVDAEDNGSAVVSDATAINFSSNLSVTDDGDGTVTINATDTNTTYTGGSNITISGTTIDFDGLGAFDSDDLSEGTSNLYYTDSRVQTYLDTGITINAGLTVTGDFVLTQTTDEFEFTTGTFGGALGIQNRSTGENTAIEFFSKDGDGTDQVLYRAFAHGTPSQTTDLEYIQFGYDNSSNDYRINTATAGTGRTDHNIEIFTEGNSEQLSIGTNGHVSVNTDVDTTTNRFRVFNDGSYDGGSGTYNAASVASVYSTATDTDYVQGFQTQAKITSNNNVTNFASGGTFDAKNEGTGTVGELVGSRYSVINEGGGTATDLTAIAIQARNVNAGSSAGTLSLIRADRVGAYVSGNVPNTTKLINFSSGGFNGALTGHSFYDESGLDFYMTGSMGIGTSSPSEMLDVVGSNAEIRVEHSDNGRAIRIDPGNGEIRADSTALHLQRTTATDVTLVQGGGNVGIGQASPAVKLDVDGRIRFNQYLEANDYELIASFNSGWTYYKADPNGSGMRFQPDGSTQALELTTSDATFDVNVNINGVFEANFMKLPDDGRFRFGTDNDYSIGYDSANDALHMARGNTLNSPDLVIDSTGTLGIQNASPNTSYALDITGDVTISGALEATTKSFVIDHPDPTVTDKKIVYGSLEGPEHAVFYRTRLRGNNVVELPDHWKYMVDEKSITVDVTPHHDFQKLYVEKIEDNKIFIKNANKVFNKEINCSVTVYAERSDVEKLQVIKEK